MFCRLKSFLICFYKVVISRISETHLVKVGRGGRGQILPLDSAADSVQQQVPSPDHKATITKTRLPHGSRVNRGWRLNYRVTNLTKFDLEIDLANVLWFPAMRIELSWKKTNDLCSPRRNPVLEWKELLFCRRNSAELKLSTMIEENVLKYQSKDFRSPIIGRDGEQPVHGILHRRQSPSQEM